MNQDNLQQDLAAGRGEYLASVSRLLGVPDEQRPVFFSTVQAGYAEAVEKDPAALLTLLRNTSRAFIR